MIVFNLGIIILQLLGIVKESWFGQVPKIRAITYRFFYVIHEFFMLTDLYSWK